MGAPIGDQTTFAIAEALLDLAASPPLQRKSALRKTNAASPCKEASKKVRDICEALIREPPPVNASRDLVFLSGKNGQEMLLGDPEKRLQRVINMYLAGYLGKESGKNEEEKSFDVVQSKVRFKDTVEHVAFSPKAVKHIM